MSVIANNKSETPGTDIAGQTEVAQKVESIIRANWPKRNASDARERENARSMISAHVALLRLIR